jgi:hypothetical protein
LQCKWQLNGFGECQSPKPTSINNALSMNHFRQARLFCRLLVIAFDQLLAMDYSSEKMIKAAIQIHFQP